MAITLPNRSSLDLTIDRIHRIPKPHHLPSQVPRDTIARIHFFQVKEEFLRALRSQLDLLDRFKNISIYPDLSAATMLRRKEFLQMGFPVKLIIFKDNSQALASWNLTPLTESSPKRRLPPRPAMITPLWSEKTRRTRPRDSD